MQLNCNFPAHHAIHYLHTSNVESLHKATQKLYRHCILITWKTNRCTTQKITWLLTYPLCLSKKWCHLKGKKKQITEFKMTHTLQLTTHTYILHAYCMILPLWHILQSNEPTQNQHPPIFLLHSSTTFHTSNFMNVLN